MVAMSSVRKAIIPVAGFGTRFLPATKAMPKEMLPIIDKPVIQHVVEEAVASGITDIILVTSSSKRSVEDHFDDNPILEAWLKKSGKTRALEEIRSIGTLANFIYVRQKGPYGNATPVFNCRHLIGDEPFAVLFGDEILMGKTPRLAQMIRVFEKYGDPVLAAIEVTQEETRKYGILDPAAEVERGVFQLRGMVEKPGPERAPSRLASIGSYVLTPDIFRVIEKTKRGVGGELVLLDAIRGLMKERPIYAKKIEGRFYDTGSKIGWLRANIERALEREDLAEETRALIKQLRTSRRPLA